MTTTTLFRRLPPARIAGFAVSTLLLLWVAIANGFPLMFADTGTYLRVGTEFYVPYDRPVTYGLAILPFHKLFGLWAVVIAQSLFATWLIDRVLRAIFGTPPPYALPATIAALALLTGLPWFTGQIMPDMFAGVVILIAWLLLFGWDALARWERWALPALLVLIVAFHLSFVPTLGAVAVVGAVAGWLLLRQTAFLKRGGIVLGAIVVAVLGLSSFNLLTQGQFRPSVSSDAFLLARLLDGHMAQPTIVEMCRTRPMILCRQDHVLDPKADFPGQYYLWSVYPTLKPAEIAQMPAEEKAVISATLHDRPGAVATMAIKGFGRLLTFARAGDGMDPYGPEMQVSQQIARHFPRSEAAWQASRQQHGSLRALAVVPDRTIGLIAALLNIAIVIMAIRRREPLIAGLGVMMIATLILNAFFCSVLSGVVERYQARVMWMPMVTLAAAILWWQARRAPANDR